MESIAEGNLVLNKGPWPLELTLSVMAAMVMERDLKVQIRITQSYGAFTLDGKSMFNENLGGILCGT